MSARPRSAPERRERAGAWPCPSCSHQGVPGSTNLGWAGQPTEPMQGSGVAGGRVCSTQGSHSARAAGSAAKATATIDQSRAGEIRHRGAPLEPLRTSALLGRVVQGLGKCHWRGSVLQYMRPTETLSCPGTGLRPQRAAQDAPA